MAAKNLTMAREMEIAVEVEVDGKRKRRCSDDAWECMAYVAMAPLLVLRGPIGNALCCCCGNSGDEGNSSNGSDCCEVCCCCN